jgi:hypothetical protein
VLLDGTPLAPALAAFQAIDFRSVVDAAKLRTLAGVADGLFGMGIGITGILPTPSWPQYAAYVWRLLVKKDIDLAFTAEDVEVLWGRLTEVVSGSRP